MYTLLMQGLEVAVGAASLTTDKLENLAEMAVGVAAFAVLQTAETAKQAGKVGLGATVIGVEKAEQVSTPPLAKAHGRCCLCRPVGCRDSHARQKDWYCHHQHYETKPDVQALILPACGGGCLMHPADRQGSQAGWQSNPCAAVQSRSGVPKAFGMTSKSLPSSINFKLFCYRQGVCALSALNFWGAVSTQCFS